MIRSILAVLGGWASVGVLVVLTDLLFKQLFPTEFVEGQMPPDRLSALSLGTSILWSVLGGWVTAKLAPSKPWMHILGLVVWGELMGILSAVMTWGQIQNWYQIGLIGAWIPAVFLGGWLYLRKR